MKKETHSNEVVRTEDQNKETEVLFEIKTVKTGVKAAMQGCCDGAGASADGGCGGGSGGAW